MSADDIRVPVKVWLRASTYRTLHEFANEHRAEVGQVLGQLADKAVTPRRAHRRKTYVKMTPERLNVVVQMHTAGQSLASIAHETGASIASVHGHLKRLGLR